MMKKQKAFQLLLAIAAGVSGMTFHLSAEENKAPAETENEMNVTETAAPITSETVEESESGEFDSDPYRLVIRDYEIESADTLFQLVDQTTDGSAHAEEIVRAVELTYENKSGEQIAMPEEMDVNLPVEVTESAEDDRFAVYRYEEDSVQYIESQYADGTVSFRTGQTGIYLAVKMKQIDPAEPENHTMAETTLSEEPKAVVSKFVSWQEKSGLYAEGSSGRMVLEYEEPTLDQIISDLPEYVNAKIEGMEEQQTLDITGWNHNYSDGETGVFVFTAEIDSVGYQLPESAEMPLLDVVVNRTYIPAETVQTPMLKKKSLFMANMSGSARDGILDGSYKTTGLLTDADKEDDLQKNYQIAEGSDENNFLLKSAEWENIDDGEALITITGQRNDIPRVLYVFITCQSHGFTKSIAVRNIQQLLSKYPIVDVVAIDGPTEWGANAAANGKECGIEPVKTFTAENASEIQSWADNEVYWRYGNHYTMNIPAAIRKYLFGSIDGTISETNMIRHPSAIFVSFDFLYDNANYGDGSGHPANKPYQGSVNDAYDSSGMLWKYATKEFFSFMAKNYITGTKRYFSMSDVAKGSSGKMAIYGATYDREDSDLQRLKVIEGVANPDKYGELPCGAWDTDTYTTSVKLTGTPSDFDYSNDFSSANVPMPEGTVKITDTIAERYQVASVDAVSSNSSVTVYASFNGQNVTAVSTNYLPGTEITLNVHAKLRDTETYFEEFEDTNASVASMTSNDIAVSSVASPKLSRFKPKLTIQYLEKGTEKVLAEEYSERVKPGTEYSVISPDIREYLFNDNAQKTVAGTMPKRNLLIKVYYVKPLPPLKQVFDQNHENADRKYVLNGDELNYEISFTNPASTEKTFILSDVIPDHTEYVSVSDGGIKEGNAVHWTFTLSGNETRTVHWTAKALGDGVRIVNNADLTVEEITLPSNDVENWTPLPPVKRVLNAEGTDINQKYVVTESELHYEISFENNAAEEKTFVITDEIPENTEFVSAADGGPRHGNTVIWNITLQPGTGAAVHWIARAVGEGSQILNHADMQVDQISMTTNTVENWTPVPPVKHVHDHEGRDIDLCYVLDGDELFYEITVKNSASIQQNFIVTDEIPENTEFIAADDNGEKTENMICWDLTLDAGEEKVLHWQAKAVGEGVEILNQAVQTVEDMILPTNEVKNWTMIPPVKRVLDEEENDIDRQMRISGQELTYVITVHNPAEVWKQAVITDVLPDGVEFLSQDDGGHAEILLRKSSELKEYGFTQDDKILTWVFDMTPGEERNITVNVLILDTAKDSILRNQANHSFDFVDLDTNEVQNPVLPDPVKEVRDDAGNDIHQFLVNEGDQLHYSITFRNPADDQKHYIISDILPEHTKFVSADHNGELVEKDSALTVVWEMDMKPHTEETVNFIVKTAGTHTYIPNTGNVAVDEVNLDTNTVENWVPEDPVKKVQNEKGEDANYDVLFAQDGRVLTYFLEVNNNSSLTKQFIVTDELDPKLVYQSCDNGGVYVSETHMITWTLEIAPNTTKVLSFVAEPDNVSTGKKILNDIEAQSDNYKNKSNIVVNYLTDSPETINVEGKKIWKMNDIDVKLPEEIKIRLKANGEEIRSERITPDEDGSWSFAFSNVPKYMFGKEVEYTIAEDPVEGYQTSIEGNYLEGFTVTNVKDPIPVKQVLNESGTDINKQIVRIGDILTYTVTYTNPFNTEKEYVITDKLPKGLRFISAGQEGMYKNGVVVWQINTPAGKENTVSVKAEVTEDAYDVLYNRAMIGVDEQRILTNEVENPVLPDPVKDVLNKENVSINHQEVRIGDELTYTITFRNPYDKEAEMTIRDRLPEGTEYIFCSDEGTYSEGEISWQLPMKPCEEKTVSIHVKVKENAAEELINRASINVDDIQAVTNQVYNPVVKDPVKKVLDRSGKDIDGKEVKSKDQLTYQITFENPYDRDVQSKVTDVIPAGLKYLNASDSGKIKTEKGKETIIWDLELKAYEKKTVSFTVEVLKTDYEVFINSADVRIDTLDLKTNEVRNTLKYNPQITPVKDVLNDQRISIDGKEVTPGDLLTYTVTFRNPLDIAHEFTVVDILPDAVEFVSADQGALAETYNKTTKVTWTVTVPADEQATVLLTVRVKNPDSEVTFVNRGSVYLNETEFRTNPVSNRAKHCDECCTVEEPSSVTPTPSPKVTPAPNQSVYIRNLPNTGDDSNLLGYAGSFGAAVAAAIFTIIRMRHS